MIRIFESKILNKFILSFVISIFANQNLLAKNNIENLTRDLGVIYQIKRDSKSIYKGKIVKTEEVIFDLEEIIKDNNKTDIEKSSIITSAAEELLSSISFTIAEKLLNSALLFNPNNLKAQFYRTLVRPLMAFEGVFYSTQTLIPVDRKDKKREHARIIDSIADGELKNFLMSKKNGRFFKEQQVQSILNEYTNRLEEARQFLRKIRGKEIELYISQNMGFLFNKEAVENCSVNQIGPMTYKFKACSFSKERKKVVIDRGDIEQLLALYSGLQVANIIATSFELNGLIQNQSNLKNLKAQNGRVTQEQIVNSYMNLEEFGKLKIDNQLIKIPKLASDLVAGAKWAKDNENLFCNLTQESLWNNNSIDKLEPIERPNRLFSSLPCIEPIKRSSFDRLVSRIEDAISGLTLKETLKRSKYISNNDKPENQYLEVNLDVNVNYTSFFKSPTNNLKEFLPTQFDECGRGVGGQSDQTFAGTFPDGDLSKVINFYEDLDRKPTWCQTIRKAH